MKIITLDQIQIIKGGRTLVTTNGSFDIMHVAHVRILQEAKKRGDILLVLLNSDKSVKLNKGESRPIIPEQERMEMIAGLECVDYVLKFDDKEVTEVLKKVQPDIHIKGGSWIPERIQSEKDLVESWGGQHICLGMIGNFSTTNIIEKIRSSKLKNKVALITGASTGIGRAIALAFAKEGAKIGVNYVFSKEQADTVVQEIQKSGSEGIAVYGNISVKEDINKMVAETIATYGKIDILVNCAAVYPRKPLNDVTKEDWDKMVDTNLWSIFYLSRSIGQRMVKQGSGVIINIASDAAEQTKTDSGMVYVMTKAGTINLTRSFAAALAPQVRVNAISPGYTLAPISGIEEDIEKRKKVEDSNPLKRVNNPKDIANMALFLASEDSHNITGENHTINCGSSL